MSDRESLIKLKISCVVCAICAVAFLLNSVIESCFQFWLWPYDRSHLSCSFAKSHIKLGFSLSNFFFLLCFLFPTIAAAEVSTFISFDCSTPGTNSIINMYL